MTQEEIDALKAQGFRFKATPEGEVRFTPEEEAEWDAMEAALANIPPPRRLIPKSVVQERAYAIGKLDELMTALQANSLYFGRWFAPDWPEVYADDAGLLEMLTAVGCTPEQIAEVTAP